MIVFCRAAPTREIERREGKMGTGPRFAGRWAIRLPATDSLLLTAPFDQPLVLVVRSNPDPDVVFAVGNGKRSMLEPGCVDQKSPGMEVTDLGLVSKVARIWGERSVRGLSPISISPGVSWTGRRASKEAAVSRDKEETARQPEGVASGPSSGW